MKAESTEYMMLHDVITVQKLRDAANIPDLAGKLDISKAGKGWLLRETHITKLDHDEVLFTFVMERTIEGQKQGK